ncbi:MAG: hypothetical protein P9L94_17860 [Candidatus Hinthialibacter antarcticus]|nr:hypothetical protein [Candidatus Hinthialibacter antarcticus]
MKKRLLQQAKSSPEKNPLDLEAGEPSNPLEVEELDLDFINDLSTDANIEESAPTEERAIDDDEDEEPLEDLKEKKSKHYLEELTATQNVHETVRDLIFKDLSFDNAEDLDPETGEKVDGLRLVKEKRKELYELLDNIDEQIQGKSIKEVSAVFTSMLDINNQLCLQKTDGVISIRTRLFHFFAPTQSKSNVQPALRQEISLIFSPEEIKSIRSRSTDMDDEDPIKPFFTMILDQAYDVVQYSETTGYLLLEMTNYFLTKLERAGFGDTPKALEFKERKDRAKLSMERSIDDLKHVEALVQGHMRDRPVLLELPKLLRCLIQVKIGLMDRKAIPQILQKIQSRLGDYARARSAVAFDFNRVPGFQHSVRLKQSIILNLHGDMLKYMGEVFEQEFRAVQGELEQMAKDIAAATETMDPNSPEYQEMLKAKARLQQKIEQQRRKMDVVRSQQSLVDVQHNMIGQAIQRYKDQEAIHQKVDEQLQNRTSIDTNTPTNITPTKKKKISRMVMGSKRR